MVNDVISLMDHLDINRAAIIGYSMGGSIAMKMLTTHPERFDLAIIGGSLGFNRYESEHSETPSLGKNLLSGMPFSEAMVKSAPADWPKPTLQQREMMRRMDATQDSVALGAETVSHEGLWVEDQQLAAIRVLTLVIYGANDHASFYENAERQFRNLNFKKIEGVGHAQATMSPEFLKAIREFLVGNSSAN
jgi:pimeloyl-ACP methyl ester carboxylesterase